MPPPRKSLTEHIASGAVAKDPQRYRNRGESLSSRGPLGKVPKHLTVEQKAVWSELVKSVPEGVLGGSDRVSLEIAVRLVLRMRDGKMDDSKTELTTLFNVMGKLGLNPVDRGRINTTPQDKPEDNQSGLDELDD